MLTQEEIVDLVWTGDLRPLLLKRFLALTEDQLQEAHGYAYGWAVIQDLGYYPLGSVEFRDLTIETKEDSGRWQNVLTSLDQVKVFTPAPIVAASPAD